MIEERRFFLRVGAFAALVSVVYWFSSYEIAGSVMLLTLGVAAGSLTAILARGGSARDKDAVGSPGALFGALATFEERDDNPSSLKLEERPVPDATLVPLVVATGGGAIAMGLVFGAWLWLPGAAVAFGAGTRWLRGATRGAE